MINCLLPIKDNKEAISPKNLRKGEELELLTQVKIKASPVELSNSTSNIPKIRLFFWYAVDPTSINKEEEITPCATFVTIVIRQRLEGMRPIDLKAKFIWATLENAIIFFESFIKILRKLLITPPHIAKLNRFSSIILNTDSIFKVPKIPNFNKIPAKNTLPRVEASTWALINQP